ncbi:MAG: hypothetical protein ACI8WT_000922 [Clostridium sp.]|jgi:hypothetical protein
MELLKRNEETLKKDNTYTKKFQFSYDNKIEAIKQDYEKLIRDKNSLENERITCIKDLDALDLKMKNIKLEDSSLENKLATLDEDLNTVRILKVNLENLNNEEKAQQDFIENLKFLNLKHLEVENLLISDKAHESNELEIKKSLERKRDLIKADWDGMYKTYYNEDQYEEVCINDEELESKFRGLKNALEEKNVDINDKEQLLKNYQSNMDRNEKEARNRGYSTEKLYELKNRNEISLTAEEELWKLKEELKDLKIQVEDLNSAVEKYRLAKSKLQGKIELLEDDFSINFGQYVAIEIKVFKFKQFEEDNITRREKLALKKKELLKQEISINKAIEDLKLL